MIPTKILRKKLLEALRMSEGYGKHEAMIRELVGDLCRETPGLQELRDVMEAALADRLIRSAEEDGEVLWYLTPRGAAKLNTL
jgi:hypothetical protein